MLLPFYVRTEWTVTKELFLDFIKYYDPEIFIGAGHRIRNLAQSADELTPTERVKKIAELFSTFKNPDKETVLTPFRVVNIHMSDCLGGWNFFDENHENILEAPRFVNSGRVTTDTLANINAKILEINSKTGLYPLYVTYSIYRARLDDRDENSLSLDELRQIWDTTIAENVFVICKTPMAKAITKRTLAGFRNVPVNAHYFENLVNDLKFEPDKFVRRVKNKNLWKKGAGIMKFDAVVGNLPYQNFLSGDNKTFAAPIYHEFLKAAFKLSDKVSLIHPARFLFNAGATPKDFNRQVLHDKHFKVVKYFPDCKEIFPTADIKGGVSMTLRDAQQNFGTIDVFTAFAELNSVLHKVCIENKNFSPFSKIVFGRMQYHLTKKFFVDNPTAEFSNDRQKDFFKSNVFIYAEDYFLDKKPDDGKKYFQILGAVKGKRIFKFFRSDWLDVGENKINFDKYKIFIPEANGSGAIGEVLSTPLVGCTQTFITVGAFDSEVEARACLAHIKSKFCRAMLGVLKVTQHNPPQTWVKVPLQDFSAASDIDWTKSVAEIDKQLYTKYNLSAEEINFIESKIKPME